MIVEIVGNENRTKQIKANYQKLLTAKKTKKNMQTYICNRYIYICR